MSFNRYELPNTTLDSIKPKLLYITQSEYDSDWHSTSHYHQFLEILFIYDGKGTFIIDSKSYKLNKGNFVLINPYTMHTEKSSEENPMKYFILGLENISFIDDTNEEETNLSSKSFVIYNYIEHLDESINFMKNLIKELKEQKIYYNYIVNLQLSYFIFKLLRFTKLELTENKPNEFTTKETAYAKQYIDTHYYTNITLKELTERTFISKFHLIHYFKKAYGVSPIEYVNIRRIKEAKFLLETTNTSITAISNNLGFSSPSRFAERFKESEKISPTEYRKLKKTEKVKKPFKNDFFTFSE